jgi:hypothetical protein
MKRSKMVELMEEYASQYAYAKECGLPKEKQEMSYFLDTLLTKIEEAGMIPPYVNTSGNKHRGQPFYNNEYFWEEEAYDDEL